MTKEKMPKNAGNFHCEFCDFTCSKESNYQVHLSTLKHKIRTNTNEKVPKNAKAYNCECGKNYKHASSLWNHKKKCNFIEKSKEEEPEPQHQIVIKEESDYKQLFLQAMNEMKEQRHDFIKQLHEQQEEAKRKDELMMTMIGKIGNTTNNNNININMFLNDKCKDALNFSEFLQRIQVSYDDLENNAQLGFVNGITKILMDNLNQLQVYERPIHCTDVKRETLYIKDDNKWEKDDSDKKLESAIQEVSRKSMTSLMDWKNENPDYQDMDSDFSKRCINIQKQSTASNNKKTYYPKIIHNIARKNTIKNEDL
tara:strand:- start:49 stop:981 length:933 start_codon:yes stop_codon:yes gene_type:complete